MSMPIVSVVAACYNESKNIMSLYARVRDAFRASNCDFELIFVDNVSTDNSVELYHQLVAQDARVCVIMMARNSGNSQPSFLAGLHQASGAAVVLLDGDIQDPPELIPQFIAAWQAGNDVVYGIREHRKGGLVRRFFYYCFYRVFKWLSYLDIPLDAGDFGLMDRRVVDIIKKLPEKDVYLRGLRSWVGLKQVGIPYTRDERHQGRTSNSFFANFFWAKKAIVNFSFKPLEYISALAACAVGITMVASVLYIYLAFQTGAPRGFLTLLLALFFFSTIQLLSLSIIAEYLIRIFQEVKARPPYVIDTILSQRTLHKTRELSHEKMFNNRWNRLYRVASCAATTCARKRSTFVNRAKL